MEVTKMNNLRLALLGFGNAGKAFARMLSEKQEEIKMKYGCGIIVTVISTHSRGTIVNSKGIDLIKVCNDIEELGHFHEETEGFCKMSTLDVLENSEYDAVCEMTPLNIFTGQPAIDHIKTAFKRKKHVVTANKGPIAWAYDELKTMAEENGVMFFYETTVMDGTPVFNLVENTLKFCKITEISGILNSTTNYILEEMAKEIDYDTILAEGKKQGFIEANEAMDIEGYDAAAKITALLNVLMNAGINPKDVDRTGIENITLNDIKNADRQGKVIKLLCKGSLIDGKVNVSVKPAFVDKMDMLASVDSTTSVISITTDLMGKISITEHAPKIEQTAYGIFGDCIRVLEGMIK